MKNITLGLALSMLCAANNVSAYGSESDEYYSSIADGYVSDDTYKSDFARQKAHEIEHKHSFLGWATQQIIDQPDEEKAKELLALHDLVQYDIKEREAARKAERDESDAQRWAQAEEYEAQRNAAQRYRARVAAGTMLSLIPLVVGANCLIDPEAREALLEAAQKSKGLILNGARIGLEKVAQVYSQLPA